MVVKLLKGAMQAGEKKEAAGWQENQQVEVAVAVGQEAAASARQETLQKKAWSGAMRVWQRETCV